MYALEEACMESSNGTSALIVQKLMAFLYSSNCRSAARRGFDHMELVAPIVLPAMACLYDVLIRPHAKDQESFHPPKDR